MKTRFVLFLRVFLAILCLFFLVLILRNTGWPATNALTLLKEKDKIIYKIDLTVDVKKTTVVRFAL